MISARSTSSSSLTSSAPPSPEVTFLVSWKLSAPSCPISVELAAVGALLADDLGTLHQFLVVDEQRAALAGGDVLGLVEAERSELSDLGRTGCGWCPSRG